MTPEPRKKAEQRFPKEVGGKEERKIKAREENRSVWFGLGMFGMVGWAVAVPTVAAVALGVWLDGRYPGPPSWTLTLLVVGVAVGCVNAWFWIKRESKKD
ncbi:MAG: AtpZ/AtpI family protein [Proteobacteria bacterium]|nr:AtpZ/AtpI family protein [Pseudomonadota bacterium]MBU4383892.1 AtpZ/AtpI family protein [Pseudomonadota bacterium]MCG2763533.1 AtpZ/AtpI family protein [Desulfarculaceae bacterium]